MKKILLFVIIVNCIVISAFSQTTEIKGCVVDNENKPLEGATIGLYSLDSVLVTGSAATSNGNFALKKLKLGSYFLQISFIGFSHSFIKINNLDKKLDIGVIALMPDNQLEEVTVTASSKRYAIDKQILIPTKSQLSISNNGWNLMRNMQLTRIKIDPIKNTISTQDGQKVIMQINGMNVENEEVVALRPEDIVRVEYSDQPGMRYQAGAIINYIVKHRESGGYISANGTHTISSLGIKRYNLNSNYNWKKSQLGIIASYDESRAKWKRENTFHYQLPDRSFERVEDGLPTIYKDRALNTSIKYTIYEADKYQFTATLRNKYNNVPNQFSDRQGYVTDMNTGVRSFLQDFSKWKSNAPSLDLYYLRNLKNKQTLIFNMVGTVIHSENSHVYTENSEAGENIASIFSMIKGTKYSWIAEGIYERSFSHSKWSTGIHHTQNFTNNKYSGDVNSDVDMNYLESYLFVDYTYSYKHFNLTTGVNGKYTCYSQKEEKHNKFYIEPRLLLQYSFSDNLLLRYNIRLLSKSPSLSELNDTEQQIDTWQIKRGNPGLLTYITYRQNLLFAYNHKIFGVELLGRYDYGHRPIMGAMFYEDGKIINMNVNQRSKHHLNIESSFSLRPLGDYLSLSLTSGMNRYIIYGNSYTHTYTNWYLRASLLANYKRWFLNADVSTPRNLMDGETIDYSESFHSIGLGYNAQKWNVSAGVMLPFTKEYSQATRNLSRLASSYSKISSRDLSCLFYVAASINLDFGTKFKVQKQKRFNSDEDSGVLSSGKVGM